MGETDCCIFVWAAWHYVGPQTFSFGERWGASADETRQERSRKKETIYSFIYFVFPEQNGTERAFFSKNTVAESFFFYYWFLSVYLLFFRFHCVLWLVLLLVVVVVVLLEFWVLRFVFLLSYIYTFIWKEQKEGGREGGREGITKNRQPMPLISKGKGERDEAKEGDQALLSRGIKANKSIMTNPLNRLGRDQ